MSKDLTLTVANVSISYSNHSSKKVEVDLENITPKEVLDQFTIEEIIDHFDWSEILDAIGIDKCKEHFDLIEETEGEEK